MVSGLNKLLRKLRNTGSTRRHQGSRRPRSVRTDDNVDSVNELILSQEGASKSHRTTRHITETNCCQNNCFRLSVTSPEIRLCSNKIARRLTRLETRSLFWLMKRLSSSVPIFGPRIVQTLTPWITSFGESCRNVSIRSLYRTLMT